MIVHTDSFFGILLVLLVMLGVGFGLLATVVLLLGLKFRVASKVFVATATTCLMFFALQAAIRALMPQTIVKRGDTLCEDIWCIGITDVTTAARAQDVLYTLNVHIFSDAGRGGNIHSKEVLFLVDEHGRRFPLIPDPAAVPYTREIAPQEGFDTTLTFAVAADARNLYLTTESIQPRTLMVRLFTGDWLADYVSSMRKPTMLSVRMQAVPDPSSLR
jgi:hypothetical protein